MPIPIPAPDPNPDPQPRRGPQLRPMPPTPPPNHDNKQDYPPANQGWFAGGFFIRDSFHHHPHRAMVRPLHLRQNKRLLQTRAQA